MDVARGHAWLNNKGVWKGHLKFSLWLHSRRDWNPRILESTVYMLMVAGWANWEIKKLRLRI